MVEGVGVKGWKWPGGVNSVVWLLISSSVVLMLDSATKHTFLSDGK
jgi:hypothetical protein